MPSFALSWRPVNPALRVASSRCAGCPVGGSTTLVMATNEIATNAYTHALIDRVRLWREDHRVVCEVSVLGSGLDDPLAGYRPLEPDQIGGYGLRLARQLTDLVEIRARTTGTTSASTSA